VGLEPTLPKEPDFESGASANSATWAGEKEEVCKDAAGRQVHSGGRKLRFVFRGVMVLKHNSNEKQ
jgi:hypothetical protein